MDNCIKKYSFLLLMFIGWTVQLYATQKNKLIVQGPDDLVETMLLPTKKYKTKNKQKPKLQQPSDKKKKLIPGSPKATRNWLEGPFVPAILIYDK